MNPRVLEAINRQINSELSASYAYLAMSAYCECQKFTGAARWLRLQSQEEHMHAMKLFDFVLAAGLFAWVVSGSSEAADPGLVDGPLRFDLTGVDRVEFVISSNPGEPLRPLATIASGGETSRLMLAVKGVLSQADAVPSLVFDEIDAGIGGRIF